jgi:hypothetical protein
MSNEWKVESEELKKWTGHRSRPIPPMVATEATIYSRTPRTRVLVLLTTDD